MSKTIVFCADGTWNGPGDPPAKSDGHAPAPGCGPELTNVCKLFGWLQGDFAAGTSWGGKEMEKTLAGADGAPVQVAKYVHGVGMSSDLVDKYTGGAFGVGVVARIARGYTFISRHYEPGDRIVIAGFSRGAYTARSLAGLIAGEGLLRPELARADDPHRVDTAAAAWFRWRRRDDNMLRRILDLGIEFVQMHAFFRNAAPLTDASFVPATIASVAVWDTVGALGIPAYHDGHLLDVFRFCNTTLSPRVAHGFHAVALDEERDVFQPTLWDEAPNVTQALFPGGHCDVGGGYAEHGLSDGPLQWIVDRLRQPEIGVRLDDAFPASVALAPDALGPRHRAWVQQSLLWGALGVHPREFPAGMALDASVRQRMNGRPEDLFGTQGTQPAYAPVNLPK